MLKNWLKLLAYIFILICNVPSYAAPAEKTLELASWQGHPLTLLGYNILSQAYAELGIKIKVKYYPSPRALYMSNSGRLDGELGRVKLILQQYPNLQIVPVKIADLEVMYITLKELNFTYSSIEQVNKLKVGRIRGGKYIENLTRQADAIETQNTRQLLLLLERKRIDIIALDRSMGEIALSQYHSNRITSYIDTENRVPIYHFLHKKQADLIPKIKSVLEKMTATKQIQRLTTEYYDCISSGNLVEPEHSQASYSCR
ncbi:substrate-binding periplasmic protein [Catenovulum sediminis]|uniref:Transporter substrate-binding domain-containing protein n=1 Tax=Catenovulum sediminis TaxID=1740262 RepID=A0ABV1RC72_9ALTE|nr:transporter substrate-binding domain-containing protein [Catenovulum sediminis]